MLKRLFKSIGILFFMFIWFYPVHAGEDSTEKVLYDTVRIKPYHISEQSFDKYYADKKFIYQEEINTNPTFIQMLWQKLIFLFNPVFASGIGRILVYGFFIFVFILLIIILFGGDLQSVMQRNRAIKSDSFYNLESELENLDEKIQTALKNKNFTEAIRLLYIYTLQKLDKVQLIVWHKEKTNRDYLKELINTKYFEIFSQTTKIFEYTWYGKFPVTHKDYQIFEMNINKLKEMIDAQ